MTSVTQKRRPAVLTHKLEQSLKGNESPMSSAERRPDADKDLGSPPKPSRDVSTTLPK